MSVTPHDPHDLPLHMRPAELGGTGRNPVWRITSDDLPSDLSYRHDPRNRKHGFIEPSKLMTLHDYTLAIEASGPSWVMQSV